jgi:hypothetical protein
VDPWKLLDNIVVQGPNGKGVRGNHGTRLVVSAGCGVGSAVCAGGGFGDGGRYGVGLFFDR